jgi:hypothetical protein
MCLRNDQRLAPCSESGDFYQREVQHAPTTFATVGLKRVARYRIGLFCQHSRATGRANWRAADGHRRIATCRAAHWWAAHRHTAACRADGYTCAHARCTNRRAAAAHQYDCADSYSHCHVTTTDSSGNGASQKHGAP